MLRNREVTSQVNHSEVRFGIIIRYDIHLVTTICNVYFFYQKFFIYISWSNANVDVKNVLTPSYSWLFRWCSHAFNLSKCVIFCLWLLQYIRPQYELNGTSGSNRCNDHKSNHNRSDNASFSDVDTIMLISVTIGVNERIAFSFSGWHMNCFFIPHNLYAPLLIFNSHSFCVWGFSTLQFELFEDNFHFQNLLWPLLIHRCTLSWSQLNQILKKQ